MLLLAGAAAVALPSAGFADLSAVSTTTNLHGAPGLIDLPSAEVAPDSTLSFSLSHAGPHTRGTVTFQITPRLSGSFRYAHVQRPLVGDTFDRSFDFRFRLLEETKYLPAVSVGINDFLGTGFYASEYLVGTKTFGDNLRVTAGLGWGRLGSHGSLGAPFGPRPDFDWGLGGTVNAKQWFRGPVAPFAGISYAMNDRLTLKAEYSSDAYLKEVRWGSPAPRSPFNFGIDYQVSPGINLAGYLMQGRTLGGQVTIALNPRNPISKSGFEPAPLPVRPRPSRSEDPAAWGTDWLGNPEVHPGIRAALVQALQEDGQTLEAMSLSATRAELRVTNHRYGASAQAVGRVARTMTRAFPASVETFVITTMRNGIPISSVTLKRSDIEALEHAPAPEMLARAVISDPGRGADGLVPVPGLYPNFTWSLAPYALISLFGRDLPLAGEAGVRLSGRYEIAPGLILSGALSKRVVGNLDKETWVSDSPLPHVRTDYALYDRQGDPSLEHLTLAWYGRPARNLYSRVTAGYLEPMFAGISGELLWKPVDSRLAVGVELAYARQRAYNQLFGLRNYGVVTGHITGYYDIGNGFSSKLSAGRYLAGDYGATLALDRVFANGWRVGGWVSLTSASATAFGNGSFDKGIHFTIPMDWALGTPTRAQTSISLRQMGRDGAARLEIDDRLFDWVEDGHADALSERWGRFWR